MSSSAYALAMRHRGQSRCRRVEEHGFTLLELLVTLAIIVGLVVIAVPTFSQVSGARLRTSTNKLSTTLRHCFGYSVSHGKYLRLVLDLDGERYWVESSDKPIFINKAKSEEGIDPNELTEEEKEEIEKAREEGRPIRERARFSADKLISQVKLEDGLNLRSAFTTNQEDVFTTGNAYVHFFPSGFVEPALIVIGQGETDDDGGSYSLTIAPLTGKVTRSLGEVEPGRYFGEPEKVEEEGR